MSMSKGQFLAEFELYVMGALARLGDEAYGMTIRQEIEARCGRPVAIGAVYATLARMSAKGYVSFQVSDPRPMQGGRSRKYVRLTPAGRRALNHSAEMLRRILPEPVPASGGRR
jgi:DNA-binding PadR family transcriptional regulator